MRTLKHLILFFVLLSQFANAQDARFGKIGKHVLEADYVFGRIIKHSPYFSPTPTQYTHGFELAWYKQTLGEKAWQRKLKYPELGASFLFLRHGNNQYFGNAYLLTAVAKFWIVRSRYVDFYVRIGSGIGIVPRHYDPIKNPDNRVIGSTLNSSAQIKLGIDIKPHPGLHITAGGIFTHYSNSAVQLPNLGVNTGGVYFGLRYFPVTDNRFTYNREKWPKPSKRHEVMLKFSFGLRETQAYGGPKYPLYLLTANYAYYTSIVNKVLAGVTLEWDQSTYEFNRVQEIETKYRPAASGLRFSIFAGDEVMIGKIGLFYIVGINLFQIEKKYFPYTKIGANYYFVSVGKNKSTKFFVGTNLKAHLFVAQYYEMSTGVAF